MKHLLAVLLVFTVGTQSLWVAAPDEKHIEKIRQKVSQYLDDGRHVSVETMDSRKFAGTIVKAGPDDFVLTNASGQMTFNYSEVKKIKAPMDTHTRGVIVTLAVLGGLFGIGIAAAANDR
jgi:hypothetical protein